MLNVLKEAAHVQPLLLKEQLDIVRHKHRVARYVCIINFLLELLSMLFS